MAKKKIHINGRAIAYFLFLSLGITGVVFLMGAVGVKSGEQACRDLRIMIVGEEAFIEQKDIAAMIQRDFGQLVGRTLATLPIQEIEQKLETIPYVEQARVHVDMNGTLLVRIRQRKAMIRILDQTGKGYYVEENGLKIPLSSNYTPRVPVADGSIAETYSQPLDTVASPLVRDLFALAALISQDSLWSHHIARIHVNGQQEIELIPRAGTHRILFGNGQDLSGKFDKLRIFYTGVVPKTGIDAYSVVNVKYKDQLVCVRNPLKSDQSILIRGVDTMQNRSNNSLNSP